MAVKVPNVDGEELDAVMNDLEREIRTMHSLDHKYIVKLIGISDGRRSLLLLDHTHLNPPPPLPFFLHTVVGLAPHFLTTIGGRIPLVIMEFVSRGSLRSYLEELQVGRGEGEEGHTTCSICRHVHI